MTCFDRYDHYQIQEYGSALVVTESNAAANVLYIFQSMPINKIFLAEVFYT